jgi:hypothetical protein
MEYAQSAIERINTADWHMTYEPSGRLHTNLTNLLSDIRQFVEIDGNPVVELDIKSCHPGCLYKVMRTRNPSPNLTAELDVWEEAFRAGQFYEMLEGMEGSLSRSQIKKKVMIWLNGKRFHAAEFCAFMDRAFPYISQELDRMKQGQPKDHIYKLLAGMESELVIRRIGAAFRDLGIKFFTVHDAVFVSLEDGHRAQEIMVNELRAYELPTIVKLKDA